VTRSKHAIHRIDFKKELRQYGKSKKDKKETAAHQKQKPLAHGPNQESVEGILGNSESLSCCVAIGFLVQARCAEYVQQEMNVYEEAYRKRLLKGLARRAKELGYQLTALPPATPDPITG
jgi:hypothetical protein